MSRIIKAADLSKPHLLGRLNAFVKNTMARWAQYPEHVSLVLVERSVRAVASMLWLVSNVKNAGFAATLARQWKIAVSLPQPFHQSIAAVLFNALAIVAFHRIDVSFLESLKVSSLCFDRALFAAVFLIRTCFQSSEKNSSALPATNWRSQPITSTGSDSPLRCGERSALMATIRGRLSSCVKRDVAVFANT